MRVACSHCGKSFSLSDENAGTHFRCPKCQKLSRVVKPIDCNAASEPIQTDAGLSHIVRPLPRPPAERGDEVLPLAELVSSADDSFAQAPLWDWPNTSVSCSSNVVLGSVPSQPPATQKPVARRKPRRQKRAGDSDRLSRFLGGLVCVVFGVAMLAFTALFGDYLRREHGLRWGLVRWVGRAGVFTIVLGASVTLSSLKK